MRESGARIKVAKTVTYQAIELLGIEVFDAEGDIMKNVELQQQAIAYIQQLSTEKLETALNSLAALRNSDLWEAEGESEKRKSPDKAVPLLTSVSKRPGDAHRTHRCYRQRVSARRPLRAGDDRRAS